MEGKDDDPREGEDEDFSMRYMKPSFSCERVISPLQPASRFNHIVANSLQGRKLTEQKFVER